LEKSQGGKNREQITENSEQSEEGLMCPFPFSCFFVSFVVIFLVKKIFNHEKHKKDERGKLGLFS
jgi:hypothetical protein